MTESVVDEMIRYVRLDAEDRSLVHALLPVVEPHFESIAVDFYERIREHEEAHAVFIDEAQVRRLHRSLIAWFGGLFGGDYGSEHFARTAHVGWVHVRIGLPQRYMQAAMTLIRARLVEAVQAALAPAEAGPAVRALDKLVDLELAVMVDAYRDHYVRRLETLTRAELDTQANTIETMERRYVRAFERAHVLVIGVDGAGGIVLFNREAERASGWALDEVVGRAPGTVVVEPEFVPVLERHLAEARPDEDRFFDAVLSTRAGHRRTVRWQLARTEARDAPTAHDVHYFLIGHDVTDEVELAERTRRAERLAAVGTLAAGLAHEIRNPLNGAHLHLTLLERALGRGDPLTAEDKESLGIVGVEIHRLGDLVNDFLQFARPQRFELLPTALGEVARRALGLLVPDAERRGVTTELDVASQELDVMGDAQRLEQVLLNLLRNAIEAHERPGGHVVLRLYRTPASVVAEVEDDGPGLYDPQAPIFDAFFTTKASGTGLGLSIAHRIAEDHGGSLAVQSVPGKTVFRLALPRPETSILEVSGRRTPKEVP